MKDNFIPVFQSIYSVYANDEEMLKGNLKYYKFINFINKMISS